MSGSRQVSVLLVDDHAVVREGYRRLLERNPCIRVAGEAADAQAAYVAYLARRPDVVVMDIALPGASGIEALRRIRLRDPQARVLMFSMYDDAVYAARALEAGACGYVTKAAAPDVLVEAVLSVARDRPYLVGDIAQQLALGKVGDGLQGVGRLTPREFEVLQMLVTGYTLPDIARSLGLTTKTVANHQSILRQKLGVETAVQLLNAAAGMGIVSQAVAP